MLDKIVHIWRELNTAMRKRYDALAAYFEGKARADFLSDLSVRRRKAFAHYLYNVVFALLAAWVLTDRGPRATPVPLFHPGDIADTDVLSPFTVDVQPREQQQPEREDLAKRVAPVFDYDDSILDAWLQNWKETFKKIREEFYGTKRTDRDGNGMMDQLEARIHDYTGQKVSGRDIAFLHQHRFSPAIEAIFVRAAEPLLGRLIAPSDLFPSYYSTGIVVRQLNQALNETLIHDVSRIWSLDNARDFLKNLPSALPRGKKDKDAELAGRTIEILRALIIPNLKFNATATQKRIAAALGQTKQPVQSLRKGQIVVHRGERVSEQQSQLLGTLQGLLAPPARLRAFLIAFLVLFVFLSVLLRLDVTKKGFWKLSLKDAVFFLGITCLGFLSVKFALPYLRLFFLQFQISSGVEYLLPVAAGGIIIHLMMGREAAYTHAFLSAIGCGILLDRNFYFSLWAFTVTASAIQSIRSCKQRTDLYRCGLWSGSIGALLSLGFTIAQSQGYHHYDWTSIGVTAFLAFLSGVLAAVLTSSFIPVLETLFGYTTSLKLLELSNFNHPLLHSLMMKAPGTYHHSVIVGSLAEIAADRIKANALLARVSAYYHDIGKMTKPLYFIENQSPNNNPHDHLSPSMSAKILFSHVKNGVKLGREYNLGNKIIDVIEQHHGTTLTHYFFTKAKRDENAEMDIVTESEFRYPGPKPQTREAAIVMICDSCEAATRSISEPTPAKIQAMVSGIINKRLLDSQFNECDLTLTELQLIQESIVRTLVSLYHHRIEYPGNPKPSSGKAAPEIVPPGTKRQQG